MEARAGREARMEQKKKLEDIGQKVVNNLKSSGVELTRSQELSVIRRLSKLNFDNPNAVGKFLDYVYLSTTDNAFKKKIKDIRKSRRSAKKKFESKIGADPAASAMFNMVINLDPLDVSMNEVDEILKGEDVEFDGELAEVINVDESGIATLRFEDGREINADKNTISRTYLDRYADIVDILGARQSELTNIKDRDLMMNMAASIYDNTIVEENIEAEEDAKTPKTEEELAKEREQAIKELSQVDFATPEQISNIPLRDSRDIANFLKGVKESDIDRMSISEIKLLTKVDNNIKKGFVSHNAYTLKNNIEARRRAEAITDKTTNVRAVDFLNFPSRISGWIRSGRYRGKRGVTLADALAKQIQENPLEDVDALFGNIDNTTIYDSTWGTAQEGMSRYSAELDKIVSKLQLATNLMSDAKGIAKRKRRSRSKKDIEYSHTLVKALELQREYMLNELGRGDVAFEAKEWLEETLNTESDPMAREAIEKVLDVMTNTFTEESMANQSFEEILSGMNIRANDLKAFNIITEVNKSLAEKALVAATLFDNRGTQILPGYTHHQILIEDDPDPTMSTFGVSISGTKSKVTTKRTSGIKPVSLNPVQSALKSARATLLDYYATPQNRLALTTINDAISQYEEKNKGVDLTKDNQYQGLLAIRKGFINSMRRVQSVYATNAKYSATDAVLNEIATLGVSSTLATVPKAIGELSSNLGYAMNNPADLRAGVGILTFSEDKQYFADVLNVLGSIQRDRLTDISDIVVKTGGVFNDPRKSLSVPTSMGSFNLYGYSRDIAEYTQGAPDRIVGKPVWIGTFSRRFEKLTGQSPDLKLIAENNEAYMNQFKAELRAATKYADKRSSKQSASASAYTGIEAFKRDNLKSGTLANNLKLANSYMQTFARYEYNTTIRAAQELFSAAQGKKGDTSAAVSAATIGGSVVRYAIYTALADSLAGLADDAYKHLFKELIGAEDDERDNVKNAKKVEGGLMFDSFDKVPEGLRENDLFIVQPGGKFFVEQENIDLWEKNSTDEFWEGMSKGLAQWGFQTMLTGKFGGLGTNLINGAITMAAGDEYEKMLSFIGTYDKEVEKYNKYLDSPLFSTISPDALENPYEMAFNMMFPSLSRASRATFKQLEIESQINEKMEELDIAIENNNKERAEEIAEEIRAIKGGRVPLGIVEFVRFIAPNPVTNQIRDNISAYLYQDMYNFEEKYDAPKETIKETVLPSMTKNQIGIIKGNISSSDPKATDKYIESIFLEGGSSLDNNISVKTELEIYFSSPQDWQVQFNQNKIPTPTQILNKYGVGSKHPVSIEEFLSYMVDPETNPENYMWWRRVNQAYKK